MRSSMFGDVGRETQHELVDAHVALGFVAPPLVHADRAVLDVAVADHEDVRHLLGLGAADPRAERAMRAVDELGAKAFAVEAIREPERVLVVTITHRQHGHLYWCEPRGKGAGVV